MKGLSLLLLLLLAGFGALQAQDKHYVMPVAVGDSSGSSWVNAAGDLQAIMDSAALGDSVFVAAGTYRPMYKIAQINSNSDSTTNRYKSFRLRKDILVYGGFAGGESSLSERDSAGLFSTNATILTGDLGNGDTAYHVVVSVLNVGNALLNGFIITGGNADGGNVYVIIDGVNLSDNYGGGIYNSNSNPTLTNLIIRDNNAGTSGGGIYGITSNPAITNVMVKDNSSGDKGGGMYNYFGSSPSLINVSISGNSAVTSGGGMYNNANSNPALTNVTVSRNSASNSGGGMYNNDNSNPVLMNVTVSGNNADSSGGGVYNSNSSPMFTNCIVYGNNSGIYDFGSSAPVITYSMVQGSAVDTANHNIDGTGGYALFADTANGNYQLRPGPVVNAGNNDSLPVGLSADMAGNPRIFGGTVDMGGYEYQHPNIYPDTNGVFYVDISVPAGGDSSGSSWQNAIPQLSDALQLADTMNAGATLPTDSVRQIWVAKGTYQPDSVGHSFFMVPKVKIYGGFAGTESSLAQRDLNSGDTSVLQGNGASVIRNDNNGLDSTAVLDGFKITGGNSIGGGGGMYNSSSSPTLSNCTFRGNTSSSKGGGGMYNSSSSPILSNCTFSANTTSSNGGGGMYNSSSSPILTNCTFANNAASSAAGMFNTSSSSPTLTNCTFSDNAAGAYGGGIYNSFSSSILTNCTFAGNTAGIDGGGIFSISSSSATITNSIFWGNTAPTNPDIYQIGGTLTITYSYTQTVQTGTGNITGSIDPFVNNGIPVGADGIWGTADDGLYLNNTAGHFPTGSSPIDAGSNAALPANDTIDLAGNTRIVGADVDMGAYEVQGSPLPVTILNYTAETDGSRVQLKWTTAMERNNKEFLISRSTDGKSFEIIGRVAGANNSPERKDYLFYDEAPENGNNFYKLQQLDFDGKMKDAGIRMVWFSFPGQGVKVFPNPVVNAVQVVFGKGMYQRVEVTDIQGKLLKSIVLGSADSEAVVDMQGLVPGVYFIRVVGDAGTEVRKVVKE